MPDIDAFIAAEMEKPFRWGETDCASTADRWVRQITGLSPLARFGRVHRNEPDGRQWLAETPLPIAVNRVMRIAGFTKTTEPQLGDVGLVPCNDQLCVAIRAARFWFSRNEAGLIGVPLNDFWKAWRVV